ADRFHAAVVAAADRLAGALEQGGDPDVLAAKAVASAAEQHGDPQDLARQALGRGHGVTTPGPTVTIATTPRTSTKTMVTNSSTSWRCWTASVAVCHSRLFAWCR